MNEFTGERVVPGQVNPDLWNEHYSRYAFASRYVDGRRVLDVGCGTGYGAAELAAMAERVVAIDISPDAVRYADGHFAASNLKFAVGSATQIPLRSAGVDVITAFEVIEHLTDWRAFIEESARVLTPAGFLLVSTPNKAYYAETRKVEGPNPYHEHEFEAGEFVAELRRAFSAVELILQNRAECLAFYPPKTFWPAEARIEGSAGQLEDAHFFIAICSGMPIPPQKSFVYLPRAVNVLREREQHIERLNRELELKNSWIEQLRGERDVLHANLAEVNTQLEEHNRWALQLEQDLGAARNRIVQLQEQYQAHVEAALATAAAYETKLAELDEENLKKTEWALETDRRLSAEIEHLRDQMTELLDQVHTTEATLEERTRWALALKENLDQLEAKLAMARESRWLRTGRALGIGPHL